MYARAHTPGGQSPRDVPRARTFFRVEQKQCIIFCRYTEKFWKTQRLYYTYAIRASACGPGVGFSPFFVFFFFFLFASSPPHNKVLTGSLSFGFFSPTHIIFYKFVDRIYIYTRTSLRCTARRLLSTRRVYNNNDNNSIIINDNIL